MNDSPQQRTEQRWRRFGMALLTLGFVVQIWLTFRSWFYFDQVLLYQLGLRGLESTTLYPYAKAVSSGYIPGALMELLIAAPLAVWMDYRSPVLLLGLFQLGGAVVLWRTTATVSGERFGTLFLAIYWLGPWRLYHAGFIWEPTYLLLPAALHLWASVHSTEEASFLPSATLGFVALAAIQLHPSGITLALSTILLTLFRLQKLHPVGTLTGATFGGATLLPTVLAWSAGTLPQKTVESSWTELGLLKVYPLFKDLIYWFRLGSLDIGRRLRQTEVDPTWEWLPQALALLAGLSVLIAVVANIRYFRAALSTPKERFLRRYAAAILFVHVLAVGSSTVTPQGWHLLVALHAACLPVTWICMELLCNSRTSLHWTTLGFLLVRFPIILTLGLLHPMYQRPEGDPNWTHIESGRFQRIELVPIPFGGDASKRGPVPWKPISPPGRSQ